MQERRRRTFKRDAGRGKPPFRRRPPSRREAPRDDETGGWDRAARWYDSLVGERGSFYHQRIVVPGALKLLDVKRGERVLDLACGQGVFSRALAERGAQVVGVDASERLVQMARRRSDANIQYHVGDARKLDFLPDGSFDAIGCLLALQNIEPMEPVLAECGRLLKPGGRVVFVINHPCFRVPRQSGWGWDEERKLQYRRVDRYLSDLKVPILTHPGDAPREITWTYHHPLGAYVRALASAGLYVDALEEWVSPRTSQPGPRARAENVARQEIPLFLAVRAVKQAVLRPPPTTPSDTRERHQRKAVAPPVTAERTAR